MRLLSLLLLGLSGCAHCPLRVVTCEERTCWQCGETYTVWMDRTWHKCEGESRVRD